MAAAFTSIMNKKIMEDESDTPKPEAADVTLVKYKKKVRDLDDKLAKEDAENKKRLLKEQRRLMGRIMPTKADNEYERSLQIIATKGVV
jgi:Rrp15p